MIQEEEQKLYLAIILRASARVSDLVSDLLTHHQHTTIKTGENFCSASTQRGIVITTDRLMLRKHCCQEEYTSLECSIMADKQKIKIALTNIIINAIDAMPAANGELKVAARLVNSKMHY